MAEIRRTVTLCHETNQSCSLAYDSDTETPGLIPVGTWDPTVSCWSRIPDQPGDQRCSTGDKFRVL